MAALCCRRALMGRRRRDRRLQLLAWWNRTLGAIDAVRLEIESGVNNAGRLAGCFSEAEAHRLAVALDGVWHALAAGMPVELPEELA